MKFNEVIGQEEPKRRLLQMVHEHRVPHAMMFCGPNGCGKLPLALAFASYLLGEREDGNAIGNAETMLRKWEHPDLHFSYPVIRPAGTSSDHKMVSDDFAHEWRTLLVEGPYITIDQWLDAMKLPTNRHRYLLPKAMTCCVN